MYKVLVVKLPLGGVSLLDESHNNVFLFIDKLKVGQKVNGTVLWVNYNEEIVEVSIFNKIDEIEGMTFYFFIRICRD